MGTERGNRFDGTPERARQLDDAIAERIDFAVARADFASAPLPDFAAVTPDPRRVLADLAARAQLGVHPRDRLHEALVQLEQALAERR